MSEAYLLNEHREWIGLLQPVGLVVSPTALARAQLRLQRDVFELQNELMSITDDAGLLPMHLLNLFIRVLGWRKDDLFAGDSINDLHVYLPERETLLKADFAVKNVDTQSFEILIKDIGHKAFDEDEVPEGRGWQATPHAKFERHLREKNISIGILVSQAGLRLLYAPKGETSGYLTFPFAYMRETQGRPVLSAMHLLLCEDRLFKGDTSQRLPALLIESRKFQNDVSTQLSEQVLAALYELLRGLQEADEFSKGRLLEDVLARDKNEVYHGLLTVLLRVVFLLYAEDRDLLSNDAVFLNNYSVNGLFARLREDFSKHHDSMNFRFGAWAHLLSLFRLIYEGAELEFDNIPGRKGHLFDPERFPFLEGRESKLEFRPPNISDGVIWRVLSNLMTLDGDRISYRALDVEQIGSVYEAVMGFELIIADGPSVAVRSSKPHGAPVLINLQEVLDSTDRDKLISELADLKIDKKTSELVKKATSVDELARAISKYVADWATPSILDPGSIMLQPGDERRRSGSHYTPRSLTAPTVSKALEPIISSFGPSPTPEQILGLRICDPAMGSGAFLVEACRQLSELLVISWAFHQVDVHSELPPDEDELLYARRLIARRCIYGVDKNPMAVNLAKLSLWLVTFARDHDFTFLDHALKVGDSLVSLSLAQIRGASWSDEQTLPLQIQSVVERVSKVMEVRRSISNADDTASTVVLEALKAEEDELLNDLRSIQSVVLYSYFFQSTDKLRKQELGRISLLLEQFYASGLAFKDFRGLDRELHLSNSSIRSFSWEIEFPEIFGRQDSGFDCFVGNPPFLGGRRISYRLSDSYLEFLKRTLDGSAGTTDLCVYFMRRLWALLKHRGTFGLILSDIVSQGESRINGLEFLISQGATIYSCVPSMPWPGTAGVRVAQVHATKGDYQKEKYIDGVVAQQGIDSFLQDSTGARTPHQLLENDGICYSGHYLMGQGFVVSVETASELKSARECNREVIFEYIRGDDINNEPTQRSGQFAINFGMRELSECEERYPECIELVRSLVKPERDQVKRKANRERWWRYAEARPGLEAAISELQRVIVQPFTAKYLFPTFVPARSVFAHPMVVVPDQRFGVYAILQSRIHELWVWQHCSTSLELLRYTASSVLNTFPFPRSIVSLDGIGETYYGARQSLLASHRGGLTEIYNRFHDPSVTDAGIVELRSLHLQLDQSVVAAYGWHDLQLSHEFTARLGTNGTRLEILEHQQKSILERLLQLNLTMPSVTGDPNSEEI